MKKIILAFACLLLTNHFFAQEANTSFVENATPINGSYNTALGVEAGISNQEKENVFIGFQSGQKNVKGAKNVFIGSLSGQSGQEGSYNVFNGHQSGFNNNSNYNTFIGFNAGFKNIKGTKNTYLGSQAGYRNGGSGNIFIGADAGAELEEAKNLLYIENSSSDEPLIWGNFYKDIVNVNGKLGVGTTNPSAKLHVNGPDFIVDQGNDPYFHLSINNNNASYLSASVIDVKLGDFEGIINETYLHIDDLANKIVMPSGSVGIGTTNPSARLYVAGNIKAETSMTFTNGSGMEPDIATNSLFLGDVEGNDVTTYITAFGEDETAASVIKIDDAQMYFNTNQTTQLYIEDNYGVGVGTTNIPQNYRLAVAGKIISEEVKVKLQTDWPDYVFAEDYSLPTLQQVENHIKEVGHLENIPSAKDVAENGIHLGEMNAKLLQKIEELTLYTIQQQQELEAQKQKNQALEERLNKLEKLINSSN